MLLPSPLDSGVVHVLVAFVDVLDDARCRLVGLQSFRCEEEAAHCVLGALADSSGEERTGYAGTLSPDQRQPYLRPDPVEGIQKADRPETSLGFPEKEKREVGHGIGPCVGIGLGLGLGFGLG